MTDSTKLMNQEDVKAYITRRLATTWQKALTCSKPTIEEAGKYFDDVVEKQANHILELIDEQKKLYADAIIGDDESLDMGGSKEAVDRHNISFDRNKLRAELRQRNGGKIESAKIE